MKIFSHLEVPALIAVPASLILCAYFQVQNAALLTLAVLLGALLLFFASYESSTPALYQLMPTAVLAAIAALGRVVFAPVPLPNIAPVSALCIIAGAVFGRQAGFMVGALAALVSNFFLGQGPWTPWQMYAWGLIGYGAGILAQNGLFKHRIIPCIYGFFASFVFGIFLNTYYLIGFFHPITVQSAVIVYGASFVFDIFHASATVVFLLVLFVPWQRKLLRIKAKYTKG
jgi:energy-coupling factor transport system substrate-specific component